MTKSAAAKSLKLRCLTSIEPELMLSLVNPPTAMSFAPILVLAMIDVTPEDSPPPLIPDTEKRDPLFVVVIVTFPTSLSLSLVKLTVASERVAVISSFEPLIMSLMDSAMSAALSEASEPDPAFVPPLKYISVLTLL